MSYVIKNEDGSFTESQKQEQVLVQPESVCGQILVETNVVVESKPVEE